jgi:hypothetical protein
VEGRERIEERRGETQPTCHQWKPRKIVLLCKLHAIVASFHIWTGTANLAATLQESGVRDPGTACRGWHYFEFNRVSHRLPASSTESQLAVPSPS